MSDAKSETHLSLPVAAAGGLPAKLTILPRAPESQIAAIEAVAAECGLVQRSDVLQFRRALTLAAGMRRLRELITPQVLEDVMELQGSPLGFLTDLDEKGGYKADKIREPVIEAVLSGFRLVGNEINIISGRCYPTGVGIRRRVLEWPGLSDLAITLGIPRKVAEQQTVVDGVARWRLEGREHEVSRAGAEAVPVKVNTGMGVDAVLGKAKAKMLRAVLERLTGGISAGGQVAVLVDRPPALADQSPKALEKPPAPAPPPMSAPTPDYVEADFGRQIDAAADRQAIGRLMNAAGKHALLDKHARERLAARARLLADRMREREKAAGEGKLFNDRSTATEAGQ